jgi:S-DNA-T family DNA segregation ATPase FtsK/SpoIIIE
VIVLSWFQNLFQKLKKEEDDDEFESYIIHKQEGQPFLNKNENFKDLETKVSYQYPKGRNHPFHPPKLRETPKAKEETLRPKHRETLKAKEETLRQKRKNLHTEPEKRIIK